MKLLFFLLTLAAPLVLVIGLIRPSLVLPRLSSPSRGKVVAWYGLGMIACAVLFVFAPPSPRVSHAPDPAMVGHWTGHGRILVDWTTQRELPMDLEIHPDGRVTGSMGTADIAEGELWNQDLTLKWLGNGTHFVHAKLTGPLVAADSVYRAEGWFGFQLIGNHLRGGFNSSPGSANGTGPATPKETMWLQAGRVQLARQ
jgi:hypothetical protein